MSDDAKPTVGFIGLGIMGSRMAANLVCAGYPLVACTRTESKGRDWAKEHGTEYEHDPAAVAARVDFTITMVVDGAQVESILAADQFLAALRPGTLCIDMSTIDPDTSIAVGEKIAAAGASFVDAPVTGSSPKAEAGTLTIMVGGEQSDFDRARPLFAAMGEKIVHVGKVGDGEKIKLINNTLAAANLVAAGEALTVAQAENIDIAKLLEVANAGSGASAMLALKAEAMRAHDYSPQFKLDHMLKDVRLCLAQAAAAGATFETGDHAQAILADGSAAGHGEQDIAAVIAAIENR